MNIDKIPLHRPTLQEVSDVLQKGLKDYFKQYDVKVVDCPDMREAPYLLAAEGLCGKPCLADVGGTEYLLPLADTDKIYDIKEICEKVDMKDSLVIGAAAGPWHRVGACELMTNIKVCDKDIINNSQIAKVKEDGKHELLPLNDNTQFSIIGNFFMSEGKPGKVIKVTAKQRIRDDFVFAIRQVLDDHYKDEIVGMGGVFLIKQGKAKMHIIPEFSKEPLKTRDQTMKWLCYFDMSAPLTCLSTLVSHDPGYKLKIEHSHCFSNHGDGGHYQKDITPDIVEYEGYFNIAEELYGIDKPTTKHEFE